MSHLSLFRCCSFTLWAGFLGAACPAAAQTLSEEAIELRSVVVEADANKLTPQQQIIPAVRATSDAWKNLPQNRVADVVKRLPGVYISGGAEEKDLRFRGLDKEYSRTQIGAFAVPDGGEKRELQLNRVPAGMVGEIEVLKLPTAEYESDGLAGRMILKPRQIPAVWQTMLGAGMGSREGADRPNTRWELLSGGLLADHWGVLGSLNVLDDNYSTNKTKETFKGAAQTKRDIESEQKRLFSNDAYVDVQWMSGGHVLNFRPLLLDQTEEKSKSAFSTDFKKSAATNDSLSVEEEKKIKRTVGLAMAHKFLSEAGWRIESDFAYYHLLEDKPDKTKVSFKEVASVLVLDKSEFEAEHKTEDTWNFSTKAVIPLEWPLRQELRAGVAARLRTRNRDKTKLNRTAAGVVTDGTTDKDVYALEENYYAAFIQDQIWFSDSFSVLPGVRFEHVTLASRTGGGVSNQTSDTRPSPHINFLWSPADSFQFYGALGKSISRPKFDDLSPYEVESGTSFTTGNPGLLPTEAIGYELGSTFRGKYYQFSASVFYRDMKNIIETVDTGVDKAGKDVLQVQNVGDGRVYGVELDGRLNFGFLHAPWLSLWANHSTLDSRVKDAVTGQARRFKDQPETVSNAGVEIALPDTGTSIALSANYATFRRFREANGDLKNFADELSVDLGVRQRFGKHFEAYLEASSIIVRDVSKSNLKANGDLEIERQKNPYAFLAGLRLTF
jgi:outer membrane receptor protein involved in Fe transport